jgi:adenosylcobinamide kinase/adenosylcobinamide-phosphate guanylyltransferase
VTTAAPRILVLGGARSGKSRRAEQLVAEWLSRPPRRAVLLATAVAGDAGMAQRIARHQADRAQRLPQLACVEVDRDLPDELRRCSHPDTLVVVDCLTLWLAQLMAPPEAAGDTAWTAAQCAAEIERLCSSLQVATGPVVLVSNEVGMGVTPLGALTREFVDTQGRMHQQLARQVARVELVVAGRVLALPIEPEEVFA